MGFRYCFPPRIQDVLSVLIMLLISVDINLYKIQVLSWHEDTPFKRGGGDLQQSATREYGQWHGDDGCMYVCMVITYSRVWINLVRLPILLVVS